jgi:glutaredoxin
VVETASGEIIVYGRKTCGFCTQMMKNLDEAKIPYTFKDIDDTKNHGEIREKLQKAGIKGSFRLPLMDINGTIKASPTFEEVKRILSDTR